VHPGLVEFKVERKQAAFQQARLFQVPEQQNSLIDIKRKLIKRKEK
jgi:hypothetical protein